MRYGIILAGAALLLGAASGDTAKDLQKRLIDGTKPTPSGVKVKVVVTESPVEADDVNGFMRAVASASREARREGNRGPNSVRWGIRWNWETESHLSRCEFKTVQVEVTFEVDLAVAAGSVAADSAAAATIAGFQESLFANRLNALKQLRDGAKAIAQEQRRLSASDCGTLATRANEMSRIRSTEAYQRAAEALWGVRAP